MGQVTRKKRRKRRPALLAVLLAGMLTLQSVVPAYAGEEATIIEETAEPKPAAVPAQEAPVQAAAETQKTLDGTQGQTGGVETGTDPGTEPQTETGTQNMTQTEATTDVEIFGTLETETGTETTKAGILGDGTEPEDGPETETEAETETEEFTDAEPQSFTSTSLYIPEAGSLPGSDELFAGYAWNILHGGGGISLFGNYGESVLNETELAVYNELKTAVGKIAAGEVSNTVISITSDLGIESWVTTKSGNELIAEADEKLNAVIDTDKIIDCLLVDCPYELYWYNKVQGGGVRTNYDIRRSTSTVDGVSTTTASIMNLTFWFSVANAYQDGDDAYIYATDTAKTGAASAAAATARQVVADNAGKTDYAKLVAYKDYICNAVSYNSDAASGSYTGGYGDPWQLIYVFDGDSSTNVVCEGYAKAFQYLCDLGGLTCYTVTGTMTGGTGEGAHMWNIVTLGGKNYLVDVTNSDSGTVGQDGGLFHAGTSGSVADGYTFTVGSQTISFTYDSDTKSLYGESILILAATDYTEPEPEPEYVASVTVGDETKNYTNFNEAWSAAQAAASATVTLLDDVTVSSTLMVENGDDITLTCETANDDYTISVSSGADLETPLSITGGSFTLQRGSLNGSDTGKGCIVSGGYFTMLNGTISGRYGLDVDGGHIRISGGTISGDTSSLGSGLCVLDTAAEVSLSGGSFSGNTSVNMWAGGTIGSILASGYAYKGKNLEVHEYWLSEAAASQSNTATPVTVQKAPIQSVSISPATTTITYGDTATTLTATVTQPDGGTNDVTYQWYRDGVKIDGATGETYTPDKLDVGEYNYSCKATADEYSLTSTKATVTVNRADIENAVVTLTGTRFEYIGGTEIAVRSVVLNGTELEVRTDYTYSGHIGKDVGIYTVKVEGKGNYTGTATATWGIYQRELTVGSWVIEKAYDGTNDISLDAADAVLYGIRYQDDVKLDASGVTAQFADAAVGENKRITYTGSFALTGETAKNYVLKYQPTLTGTITKRLVSVTQDSLTKEYGASDPKLTYQITSGSLLAGHTLTLGRTEGESEGSYAINTFAIVDQDGNDVAGNYDVTLEAVDFQITKSDLATATVTLEQDSFIYDGTEHKPTVTVVKNGNTLTEGTDYTVNYEKNVDAGTASATITAVENGNYYGTQTVEFKIEKATPNLGTVGYTGTIYPTTALTDIVLTRTDETVPGTLVLDKD